MIILVRHGEATHHTEHLTGGWTDSTLTGNGKQQMEIVAKILAKDFEEHKKPVIFTSDLQRAVQTATPMPNIRNLPSVTFPAFREICFGKWEGLTFKEIKAQWPSDIELFFNKPKEARVENGEGFQEVQDRAWAAFEEIVEDQTEDTSIMLVAHGGIVRVLLCAALGLDLDKMWEFYVDNASLSCIIKWEGKYLLKFHNYVGKI